ncbi:MAG: FKBP-type peptidyl-prolyl cis-trans isomerase N-terminal domain-containing protein, partial [Porticoccus sp.]|nr:FKBP-type peptidyl-prolyl cis-trans isomerase N-terminal domain-containing protein [Porticoccus sp.]
MKVKYLVVVAATAVALAACNEKEPALELSQVGEQVEQAVEGTDAEVALSSQLEKFSYIVGVDMGGQFRTSDINIDRAAFAAGLADSLDNKRPRIEKEELETVVKSFHADQQAKIKSHEEEQIAASEKNIQEGGAFLAANSTKDGVNTTDSGMQY